jgi:putative DNA primase/helicase
MCVPDRQTAGRSVNTIDFEGINSAALRNARSLLPELIPGGKFRSLEYVVLNPRRNDKKPGSFTVNYRTSVWKDFATNDGGSDLISLVAYIRGIDQGAAARELADKLCVPFLRTNGIPRLMERNSNNHNGVGAASEMREIHRWGDEGPPTRDGELRRHVYAAAGCPLRVKIKLRDGSFRNWYRVFSNGVPIGWQPKKPDDYIAVPYVTDAIDPFDVELKADDILWPEGEKDVDSLNGLNLPAFTFGGVGDGLPDGIGPYLKDRRLVILADNDDAGRGHAEKKAAVAQIAGAATIKLLHFEELLPKGDVSDFIADGGTVEQLIARMDAGPIWSPQATPTAVCYTPELVIKCANDVVPRPVAWLWPGRIAIGKQTLIAGEPGLGKSQIATSLVAAVTTGGAWPHEEGRAPLGNAIILSAEDGIADTIVPRLHAAQADCKRAFIISAVRNDSRLRTFNLQADLALLEQKIDWIGDVRLIVIDPISSYMGAIDSHKNTDVRSVLEAVGEMAERQNTAIVGITHFSKGAGQRAINAFMGSVAFIAAARAAFAVMKDSADESKHLFLPVKNNLAPLGLGLALRLVQHIIPVEGGAGIVASTVSWDSAPVTSTADEMMAANAGILAPHTAKTDCVEFLRTVLANGWTEVADITAEAIGAGLHAEGKQLKDNKPMRDARTALKVETHRDGFGKGARYFWAFPGTPWAPSDPIDALSNNRAPMDLKGAHGGAEGGVR